MDLTDRINEIHEKYVFPFAAGFCAIYFFPTWIRLIDGQLDDKMQKELFLKYGRYIGDLEENIQRTKTAQFMGSLAGTMALELMPKGPDISKFEFYLGLTNGASLIYEILRVCV